MHETSNYEERTRLFSLFQTSYGRFCVSDLCIGHIYIPRTNEKKGESSVCWLAHDQHGVKNSHPTTA